MSENKGLFSPLNAAEKRSKLRQLGQAKGQVTIWRKGDRSRISHRVKDYDREEDILIVHGEPGSPTGSVLGTFDMNGVSYFLKAAATNSAGEILLKCSPEFYKSERRRNFRLLTYPVFQVTGHFQIPATYEDGKVIDIQRRPTQTGLFKNFLKLVDGGSEGAQESRVKIRLQDISATGMSVFVGPAELAWFKTGEEMKDTEIHFPDEVMRFPRLKIVYVVDHIGEQRGHKRYKVGLRFEDMPAVLEQSLNAKIDSMLKQVDTNKDFEEFIQ